MAHTHHNIYPGAFELLELYIGVHLDMSRHKCGQAEDVLHYVHSIVELLAALVSCVSHIYSIPLLVPLCDLHRGSIPVNVSAYFNYYVSVISNLKLLTKFNKIRFSKIRS